MPEIAPHPRRGVAEVEEGARLAPRRAAGRNIPLTIRDDCAVRGGGATGDFPQGGTGAVKAQGTVPGAVAGRFPQLRAAPAANPPDQVITP